MKVLLLLSRLASALDNPLHIWVLLTVQHDVSNFSAQNLLVPTLIHQHFHDPVEDVFSLLGVHPSALIFTVCINKDCSCQGKSRELPSAHSPAPFFAGAAVAVPVHLLGNSHCLLSCHSDASRAGDKGVRELLQGGFFILLQRFALPELPVGLLQHMVVHPLHLERLQVQPQDSVDVGSTTA